MSFTIKDQMQELVQTQEELCFKLDVNWREKGWDFRFAAVEEVLEATEHLKWHWWKHRDGITSMDIDWESLHYEVADVFNPMVSYLLRECSEYRTVQTLLKGLEKADLEGDWDSPPELQDIGTALDAAKELMRNLLGHPLDDDTYGSYLGDELTAAYFRFVESVGLSFGKLRAIILAKAELIILRRANGFREGTYINRWNGVKDDVFLKQIVNITNEKDPNYRELIARSLEGIYAQVKEQVHAQVMAMADERKATRTEVKQITNFSRAPRPPHETNPPSSAA